eukprot:7038794-Alexandrium_andersonii.AAC.1
MAARALRSRPDTLSAPPLPHSPASGELSLPKRAQPSRAMPLHCCPRRALQREITERCLPPLPAWESPLPPCRAPAAPLVASP